MNVAAQFGENLLRERKRIPLTQDQLAFRAGLHRTEIGMLERGVRLARIDTLVKLSGALEISPDQLLKGLTWDPPTIPVGQWVKIPPRATGD